MGRIIPYPGRHGFERTAQHAGYRPVWRDRRDAVLAELRAAFMSEALIRDHVATKLLIVLGMRAGPADEVWILHAAGRLPSRKLAALMDVVAGIFAE